MSTTDAPHHTRSSNATTWPGQIVLNAQGKRCIKAQKLADDLALKEAKELREAKVEQGLKCLAGMQNEMQKVQEEILTKKAVPIRPKPKARKVTKPAVKTSDDHINSIMEAGEADDLQDLETGEQMDDGTTGGRKKKVTKKGGKTLIKDAISNMQKKINKPSSKGEGDKTDGIIGMAHVSDGKDSALLNATSQKLALGGRVTNWVSGVKPKGKLEHPKLASAAASSVTRAPPTSIFTQGTASTIAMSDAQVLTRKPAVPAEIPDTDDALVGSFADDIDDTLEHEAAIVQGKGKLKVTSIFEDDLDFEAKATSVQVPSRAHDSDDDSVASFAEQERFSLEPWPPFTQVDTHQTLKCKTVVDDPLDDDEVSEWSMDIDGPAFEDPVMISDEDLQPEPVVLKKKKIQRTTSSTSVSIASVADSKPPALKKAKIESSVKRAHNTPAIKHPLNVDTVPDCMKSRSTYHNVDLPAMMQADQRWTKKYLPTVMLWAGSYEDIWTIPDDILLLHTQLIFNAVYKELNITIVHGSVIHSLSLVTNYAFLFENPDKPNPLTVYRSPFVLQLLGTTHLNAINGYVKVSKLDMHGLATHGMSGVISLSAAVIERALNMFAQKHLNVKHPVSCLQKAFQQDSAIDLTWASAASSTKCTGPSSPSSSPTVTNDFLDDDTNVPTSLPPIVRHLSRVVKQAKEKKYKPYNQKRPRTMELRFAEKYIGPSGMDPVDARRGKVLVERGLKHLSCEAIAQAVLTKEADLEWKHLCALASAWEIKARTYASAASESLLTSLETLVNSNLDSGELQTRMAFAISAYSEDKSLYSAANAQLDNLEYLAREHYSEAVEDHLPTSPTDADRKCLEFG